MALIAVLTLMGALLSLSVVGARLAVLGERGARNDRDAQSAFHAAEAALADAEADLMGAGGSPAQRTCAITGRELSLFEPGCGASGNARGLCAASGTGAAAAMGVLEAQGTERRYATYG
ncbi:MAG: PilX N-terminal domain-containing pilus assembly protein, partial [Burkholderiaceae bacterium]